jgi:tetratricopeptide (TPR) repeat protein
VNLGAAFFWSWVLVVAAPVQSATEPLAVALNQFERGDYRAAIGTLSSALMQSPQDARLYEWRSRCYLELEDYALAITDGERAVSERPADSEYRRWLGRAYGGAAEQARSFSLAKKVRRTFEEAVRLDPSNLAARRDLAEFYIEAPWIVGGSSGKALEQIEAIAKVDAVAGHLARASYSRHEKRLDDANTEYEHVLALRPGQLDPYLEVADFYEQRGDADKFASVIEQAVRVGASDRRLPYYKGVALVLANRNLAEADQLLRTYLATAPRRSDFPSHASAHLWLGRLNQRLGNTKVAADEYRTALALDPDRKPAREALQSVEATGHRSGSRP